MLTRNVSWMCLAAAVLLAGASEARAGVVIIDGQVTSGLELDTGAPETPPDFSTLTPEEQELYLYVSLIMSGHDATLELLKDDGDLQYGDTSGSATVYVPDDVQGCSSAPV